jgi:hypothetical protein
VILRDGNGCKDTDYRHNNQDLNQCKTFLVKFSHFLALSAFAFLKDAWHSCLSTILTAQVCVTERCQLFFKILQKKCHKRVFP